MVDAELRVDGIQARIAAAKAKQGRLAEQCADFMAGPKPYDVYVEATQETGMFAVRLRVLRDPPADWGVDMADRRRGPVSRRGRGRVGRDPGAGARDRFRDGRVGSRADRQPRARDLNPVDEARGYQALLDRGLTIKGIADRLGKVPQK